MEIAAQLHTIRKEFAENATAALARLRMTGYEHVELADLGGQSAENAQKALTAAGVSAISMHVPLNQLVGRYRSVVAHASRFGVEHVVVPALEESYRRDGIEGYRRGAYDLSSVAERLSGEGLTLHYHNHDFELLGVGGRTPLEVLLEGSGSDVGFELDFGWIRAAGHDPTTWLHRAGRRVRLAHFKDVAIGYGRRPRFCALGDGVIDWAKLIKESVAAGVAWAVVEDDHALDPFESLERSRLHIRHLTDNL
jgi:sugar phosphate isomerase/epimerase